MNITVRATLKVVRESSRSIDLTPLEMLKGV